MIKINNFKQKTTALLAAILLTGTIASYNPPTAYGFEATPTSAPVLTQTNSGNITSTGSETPKEANSLVIRHGYKSAPIYDAKTKKIIGTIYSDFSININSQKDGNAYFKLPLLDKKNTNKAAIKQVYVPIKYLTKAYIEPTAVITVISLDQITIHKNAPIYNHDGKKIAIFKNSVGPMNFIQKTDKGYMLTLDNNLILLKEKDVDFHASKIKL